MKGIFMTKSNVKLNPAKNNSNDNDNMEDSIRLLADLTRREIDKAYNINNISETETYYSNRYGWSLRKTIS